MSDLEFRRHVETKVPRYPSPDNPGPARPTSMIGNAAAMAPLVLLAVAPAWSGESTRRVEAVECESRRGQEPKKALQRLSEAEVEGLVGSLEEAAKVREEVDGFAAPRANTLTEFDVKALLAGFLKKNGYEAAAGKLDGVAFDAVDATRRLGVKVLSPEAAFNDIAMIKARGEARLLVLDATTPYGFGGMPTKRGAVHALLAELERFLNE